MNNIINLFRNSPRLSNNILPRRQYNEATIFHLENALARVKIKELMKKSASLSLEDIKAIDLINSSALIDYNSYKLIREEKECHI